jgi:hypothetical protein
MCSPSEAQTRRCKAARPIEFDEPLPVRSLQAVFDGPVDRLARMCRDFLSSPGLDGAQALHDEFGRYLSLPDSLGQAGLFLLRGGLTEMFAQVSLPRPSVS